MSFFGLPDEPTACTDCGAAMPDGREYRIGKGMWHLRRWTCRCAVTLTCPTCYKDRDDHKCPKCGNTCEYT
jgi:hypothetical protein